MPKIAPEMHRDAATNRSRRAILVTATVWADARSLEAQAGTSIVMEDANGVNPGNMTS